MYLNLECTFDGELVTIVKIEPSQSEGFVYVNYLKDGNLKKKEVSIFGNIATDVTNL